MAGGEGGGAKEKTTNGGPAAVVAVVGGGVSADLLGLDAPEAAAPHTNGNTCQEIMSNVLSLIVLSIYCECAMDMTFKTLSRI